MTKDEIESFSEKVTYGNHATEIEFNDGRIIIGYFDATDKAMKDQNKWHFFVFPKDGDGSKKQIVIDGHDIKDVTLRIL